MTATDIIVFVHNHDMTRQNFDLLAVKMLMTNNLHNVFLSNSFRSAS